MSTERGFTVLEVLLASALLLIAVAGGLSIVARARATYRDREAQAGLQETANAALDLLAYEVRMAGYTGLLRPASQVAGSQPLGLPEPPDLAVGGGCLASLALDLATPVAGADGIYEAATGWPLTCAASPGRHAVTGSDTLVLRHASSLAAAPDAGRLQLETTRLAGRLLADGQRRLDGLSAVNDVEVGVYYVSEDSTAVPGWPSLRRKRLVGGSSPGFQDEELQDGVSDLQVEALAAVTDATGNVSLRHLNLSQLSPGMAVLSLRLWVLVRSEPGTAPLHQLPALEYSNRRVPAATARFDRLLASRTVALRNSGASR